MTIPQLIQQWRERQLRLSNKAASSNDERDRVNYEAKAAELEECINELRAIQDVSRKDVDEPITGEPNQDYE